MKSIRPALGLTLLFSLFLCTRGRAQIVNIEDKRKSLDSIGWFGQLDLSGSLTKNNNTVLTAGSSLRLVDTPGLSEIGSAGLMREERARELASQEATLRPGPP